MRKWPLLVAAAVLYAGGHHAMGATAAAPAVHGSNEALANQMAASMYGWAGQQAACLDSLWSHENDTWDPTRWNGQRSGAYGIPQALPASKMASAGPDWQTSPATQIKWGLGNIKAVYGSPCGAWSAWLSRSPHWY